MSQDEKNKNYTKILLRKILEYRKYLDYDLIEESFYEVLNSDNTSFTTEEIIQFSETFSGDLSLVSSQIERDAETKKHNTKKYIINGFELTRDY
jgi:hypothetical protein